MNLLAARVLWQGARGDAWFWFVAAVVLLAAVLIVRLQHYERSLVSRPVGWSLLVLRLAVVASLLLAFLEPVLSWTRQREQRGRIILALDLSESMDTVDKHAPAAEKLRWARALGLIGNDAIDDRLDAWQRAFDEGGEVDWVGQDEARDPAHRAELQRVRREFLNEAFEQLDRMPRREIAFRLMTAGAKPLLETLESVEPVELRVFGGETQNVEKAAFEGIVSQPPASLGIESTDLSNVLKVPDGGASIADASAVVLLTDGRNTSRRDPETAALGLKVRDIPVFPVLMGSDHRPRDLAIGSLDYRQSVFQDDRALLKADISTSGFEGEVVAVTLRQEGQAPVTREFEVTGTHETVDFPLKTDEVGRFEYEVQVAVREGETRDDNNAKSFAFNVIDDKAAVMVLEGEARWEFRYLDNAFRRDKQVRIERVVFRQPYLGVLPTTFFPKALSLNDPVNGREISPFAEVDLLIVGDVAPGDMPERTWELIQEFVGEAGGTLVLVAGKTSFPLAHTHPVVAELLPVTNLVPVHAAGFEAEAAPTSRGFRLRLTPEGEAEPVLQFDEDVGRSNEIWSSLPGHMWGLRGEARKGATVLAHAAPLGQPLPLEAERSQAIIAHQHYGFGQVLWLGIDSTWRWRHRVGDRYHHRFWGQLARWAAENRAGVGNEVVRLQVGRTDLEVGEPLELRARWTRQFLHEFPDLKSRVKVFKSEIAGNEPFTTIDLLPMEARPTAHEGRASLPAGTYRIELEVENAELPDDISTMVYVHQEQTEELSDLTANRDLLARVADASGGRLLMPDEIDQLPELLTPQANADQYHQELPLWSHWSMLLLFFSLLTTEWVVRKLNGLP